MPDLSQVKGRTDAQERVLARDDSILPTRRITDVPSVGVEANIRNAERGNPGAQELRQTLGMVDEAQSALVNLNQRQYAETEKQNANIAAGDSVTGSVNADLMAKSVAYRQVIAGGRATKALAEIEANANTNAQNLLAQGATADPTKGDQAVGLDEVNAQVEKDFRAGLIDKDGHPIDFGDPSANVVLYKGLAEARERILTNAAQVIRTQEQGKAKDALGSNVEADLIRGDTSTLERNIAQAAKLGITPQESKKVFLDSAINAAMETKSVDPIVRALNSARPDGTPTWSEQEKNTLLERQHALGTQFEAEHRTQMENQGNQWIGTRVADVAAGKLTITPGMVQTAVDNHELPPEFADRAMQLQHQQDAWAQQKVAWQREAASAGRTAQIQTMELLGMKAKRDAQAIIGGGLARGMNGQQLMGKLISHAGKLDPETLTDALEFAQKLPKDEAFVTASHAENHLIELDTALTAIGKQRDKAVLARRGGIASDTDWAEDQNRAHYVFFQQLRLGATPDDALGTALTTTNQSKAFIQYTFLASRA